MHGPQFVIAEHPVGAAVFHIDLRDRLFDVHLGEGHRDAPEGPDGFYSVDHTSTLFVVDTRGRLRLRFSYGQPVDEMLPDIEYLIAEGGVEG